MDLGRLTLYKAITRLGRSNSFRLLGDKPALTFIQEPVLGARERCVSPRRVGLPIASIGWKNFTFMLLSLRLRFLWLVGAITPPPSRDQAACHFPKPILLNTVRTRAASVRGRRTIRAYYLFVLRDMPTSRTNGLPALWTSRCSVLVTSLYWLSREK